MNFILFLLFLSTAVIGKSFTAKQSLVMGDYKIVAVIQEAAWSGLPQIKVDYSVYKKGKYLQPRDSSKGGTYLSPVRNREDIMKFKVKPFMSENTQLGWVLEAGAGNPHTTIYHWIVPSDDHYGSLEAFSATEPHCKKNVCTFFIQAYLTGGTATSVYLPRKIEINSGWSKISFEKFGNDIKAWPLHPYTGDYYFPSYFLAGMGSRDIEMMEASLQKFDDKEAKDYPLVGAPGSKKEAMEIIALMKKYPDTFSVFHYFK